MRAKLCFFLFSTIFLSAQLHAHGGGLNSSGCHNDRKNGGYHCHRSSSSSSSSSYSNNASKSYSKNNTKKSETLPSTIQKSAVPYSPLVFNRDVYTTQIYLQLLGYNVGQPDGLMGTKTRKAIEEFQSRYYQPVNGSVSKQLVIYLKNKIQQRLNN